jgi:hypothetical protein
VASVSKLEIYDDAQAQAAVPTLELDVKTLAVAFKTKRGGRKRWGIVNTGTVPAFINEAREVSREVLVMLHRAVVRHFVQKDVQKVSIDIRWSVAAAGPRAARQRPQIDVNTAT